jgi:hypothetical protein
MISRLRLDNRVRSSNKSFLRKSLIWLALKEKEDGIYLFLLVVIAIATHMIWFTPGTNLFHSDWSHWPNAATGQAWAMEGSWKNFLNFGTPNIQIGYFFVTILWPFIALLGGSFDAAAKLTVMIPIAIIGFVGPYLAMRKLTENKFISFVTALFYGSTTYFLLRQGAHLQIAFAYAIAPLILFLFLKALETMKTKNWLFFALAYSVSLCYGVRITYILTFVLGLYAVLFFPASSNAKKLPKQLLITSLFILCLNSFWLLPTLFGAAGSLITETTSRSLFASYLFDLPHALTLSSSAWTGGAPNENFIMEPIRLYLWLIPLIAFIPLTIGAKMSLHRRKQTMFFLIVALSGIFLTKQALDPLPQAYPWLYTHFPGFSLFREASKFDLLTALGYMGLLGFGLIRLKTISKKIYFVTAAVVVGIACINLLPLVTGEIGTLFVSRNIPHDYVLLNRQITATPGMARTLWVPSYSQWAYFDALHPKISAVSAIQQDWKSLMNDSGDITSKQIASFFGEPFTKSLMDSASVKFVVVPLRDAANGDDFFRYYGDDRQFYIDVLNKVPWLKRINIGTKEVVVYENQSYKPYISAGTNLLTVPSLSSLGQVYTFNANSLRGNFNFALNDKQQVKEGTEVQDIFSNLSATDIHKGRITTSVTSKSNQPVLYTNTNEPSISYKINKGAVEIFATQHSNIHVNGQSLGNGQNSTKNIGTAVLNHNQQYFIAIGDQLTSVDTQKDKEHDLGIAGGQVRLVSSDKTNLITNPSLENGLWESKVEDCNDYDQNAGINMNLSLNEHTQGQKSLQLTAINHDACSGPKAIPVTARQEYLFSFDYKAKNADEVGYQVIFNDPKHTAIKKYPPVNDESWHTVRQSVLVPEGATKLAIKLLSIPGNSSNFTTTFYDNVNLTQLATSINTKLDLTPQYTSTVLKGGRNTFEYVDPAYTGQNLIPNPSLEKGTWQKEVGDCNVYDNNPELKMSTSNKASNGKKSLELAAKRHDACTGPNLIAVKENATYLISFDHQSPNAESASYYIGFNDNARTTIAGSVPTDYQWQSFKRVIRIPPGANNLQLLVYANADANGNTYIVNRYDNFKLIEVSDIQDQYYLVSKPSNKPIAPKKVNYTLVNPTKKLVHVRGASGPFYLTMGESYNPRWRLELDNSKASGIVNSWTPWVKPDTVAQSNHIKWDGFMNGWYIDPARLCQNKKSGCTREPNGSYDMELMTEFTPQRWFYLGTVISCVAFVACIGYLVYSYRHDDDKKVYRVR